MATSGEPKRATCAVHREPGNHRGVAKGRKLDHGLASPALTGSGIGGVAKGRKLDHGLASPALTGSGVGGVAKGPWDGWWAEQVMTTGRSFDEFVVHATNELRRAYAGNMAADTIPDAVAHALAYAWEHQRKLRRIGNPIGYLYRVGQSRSKSRRRGFVKWDTDDQLPDIEPALPAALAALPANQASAVWLVKACGWTNVQAAEALAVSPSTVATHVSRGMDRLGRELGVDDA